MRQYVVRYLNELGVSVTLTVQAISTWAAKWVAVSEHNIPFEKIEYAV